MPDDRQWMRIRSVVEAALSRPPDQRRAFVADQCEGDVELRRQVDQMLSSVEEASLDDEPTLALDMTPAIEAAGSLIGKTLAHYEILEKIGQGGMGEVYRARDTKLGREVAIKALPPEFAEDPGRLARFEREARLLASINHPNIATIHGVETSGSVRFLVLELVEGQGLEQRIGSGPMAVDEATDVFVQIAEALQAAHEKGIIHRDLKPANVKITPKGHVKVLDFGLAKAQGAVTEGPRPGRSRPSAPGATRAGTIVGTIAYMSPEQARGRPVDKRTDVWSFGCTLYETLTGKAPFRGESVFDTIARIIERDPDWSELPTDVPPRVHRVLRRCLAKDPAQRFGSIETARDELAAPAPGGSRRTIAVTTLSVLSLFVLLAVWWAVSNRSPEADGSGEPAVEAPVVAVAEMRNLTGDSRLDWLGEGLANLVRDRLSESRHVAVVSRSRWDAIVARNDEAEDPGGLAAVSGIDYLVSGELLSAPDGLVLTARVTDVRHGVDAVARRFDGQDEQALLDSTNQLALLAKQALGVPHTETVEVFAADFAAQHPAAYESYLAGLQYFDGFDFDSAERAFRTALDLEPEYHVARYRLAHVLYVNGRVAEAQQAIDEIPDDAELSPRARLYIDAARALFERDWEAAKTRYRALLDEFPYEIEARQFLAEVYDAEYDDESALEQLRILAEQEPEKPAFWSSLGETYLRVGQLEQAAEAVDRYQRLEPEDPYGFSVLGDIERVRGRLDLAESRYRHALELDPAFQLARLGLATTLAVGGSHAEAETLWSEMVADADEQPGFRIDAAFELSYLLQSRGRFGESIAPLVALEAQIEEEGFREALGFVVRGIARLELGELEEAAALIDRAVEHAPSAPTRYLFARGRLQLELGNLEAVRATAEEIRTFDLPPEEEDRAEERAAAYLEALVFLAEGDAPRAVESARQAVELVGYPYALYRLGLVEALRSTGRRAEAAEVAAAAANDRDPVDPRLDLELDRTRAMLAEAEIRSELGQDDRARRLALECLSRWADADPALTEVAPARRLSGRP